MLYPKNIEQKLGFDQIRTLLTERCISTLGIKYVSKIRFSNDFSLVEKLTQQTAEFVQILTHETGFPSQNYVDPKEALKKARIEGAFLTEEELFDVKLALNTIVACITFLKGKDTEQYPALQALTTSVEIDKVLIKEINQVIDDRGRLRDNASPELQAIRRELISREAELGKKIEQILKSAKSQGYTSDDASVTIRGGRLVIPVTATHKRQIKGFIHDESDTGQTVYLEPTEILDRNNEIKELQNRERREIVRILTALTNQIRPHIPQLQRAYNFLGMIDFIRAKALLAIELKAIKPTASDQPLVDWYEAVHPLLYLAHQAQNKKVVPIQIALDAQQRIVVISGPNAGGKSITLKTVGLLQYMYQCGLLIPVAERSKVGLFKSIFIDIGDEQSLENDLSTYSSHLTNMRHFVNFTDEHTLFLIDEFGTGTEPRLGGAIAEAILEILHAQHAYGVINTHYGNLKVFAQNTTQMVNGAMRFDLQALAPLYQLEIGQAGSSFAFEIAQKIGLPKKVLAKAKEKLGDKELDFDKTLREIEKERKKLTTQNQELRRKEQKYQHLLEKYEKLNTYLETEKKKILNQAKQEAKMLLEGVNQKIETTIRKIKEEKAEKTATKALRKELKVLDESIEVDTEILQEDEPEEIIVLEGEITVGDFVRIKGQNTIGEVLQMKGKDVEIRIGALKSTIKQNRLEKISKKAFKKEQKEVTKRVQLDINEKALEASFQLDVRGQRGEQALQEVEKFLDNAILVGYQELRIVHGKGDGILKRLIREKLREYKQVKSFKDEHADLGGAGVTVITMK